MPIGGIYLATAQSILDLIDAAIIDFTTRGCAQTLSVGGRSVSYTSLDSLLKARKEYASLAGIEAGNKLPFRLINIKPKGVNNAD